MDDTISDHPPQIGRYELTYVLGKGSHGVVFAGYDTLLGRPVAIKVFADSSTIADAQREATIAASIGHPNVITVHDVGEAGGLVFLVMEFVIGGTVHDYARTWHEWREVVTVFVQAGRGLAAVHEAGFVHGDVKPTNMLMSDRGRVLICDFGLARSTLDAADRGGTPGYMAPERFAGAPADTASDQFSFCVSLWWAIYRVLPWETNAPDVVRVTTPRRDWHRVDVPASLVRVLMRGLAVDPRQRFEHMGALVDALTRVLVQDQRRRSRRWALFAALAAVACTWLIGR